MRSKLTTLLTVIGAVTVLVLAANTVAMATTGKAILAGKVNTASKLTSITRTTSGTGLQVKTKSSANAPFAVNGKGRVANLNADKVDGLDSTQLEPRTTLYSEALNSDRGSNEVWTVPLAKGTYNVSFNVPLTVTTSASVLPVATCFLQQGARYYATASGPFDGSVFIPGLSGTAVVPVTTADPLVLHCNLNVGTFQTTATNPVRVSVTPLSPTATAPLN